MHCRFLLSPSLRLRPINCGAATWLALSLGLLGCGTSNAGDSDQTDSSAASGGASSDESDATATGSQQSTADNSASTNSQQSDDSQTADSTETTNSDTSASQSSDSMQSSGVDNSSDDSSGDTTEEGDGFPEWSTLPPGGLDPAQVPQFVAITFDDNFGLESDKGEGGVDWLVKMADGYANPAGSGQKSTFDGADVRFAFYHTSSYIDPDNDEGGNLKAWKAAFAAGHEAGDHTVQHHNGGEVEAGGEKGGKYSVAQWVEEIGACRDALTNSSAGVGAKASDIFGFRTPFLSYNDNTFAALVELGFTYDTSLLGCFDAGQDGSNCSWPYSLAKPSPDAKVLASRFKTPEVLSHPGLVEFPPLTLVIPPDEEAEKYGFEPGLRARIPTDLPYSDIYDPATGHLAGLDYTALLAANMTPDEMAAALKYTLDVHLAGNRAPMVFVAHAHLYAFSDANDNPDTPSQEIRDARQAALVSFIEYALSKPEVRLRSPMDIHAWMLKPTALK